MCARLTFLFLITSHIHSVFTPPSRSQCCYFLAYPPSSLRPTPSLNTQSHRTSKSALTILHLASQLIKSPYLQTSTPRPHERTSSSSVRSFTTMKILQTPTTHRSQPRFLHVEHSLKPCVVGETRPRTPADMHMPIHDPALHDAPVVSATLHVLHASICTRLTTRQSLYFSSLRTGPRSSSHSILPSACSPDILTCARYPQASSPVSREVSLFTWLLNY
jgi:hypothetical protein